MDNGEILLALKAWLTDKYGDGTAFIYPLGYSEMPLKKCIDALEEMLIADAAHSADPIHQALALLSAIKDTPPQERNNSPELVRELAQMVSCILSLMYDAKGDTLNRWLHLPLTEVIERFDYLVCCMDVMPFDLAAARSGSSIKTADGRSARIICYDAENSQAPLVVLVKKSDRTGEEVVSYQNNGQLPAHIEGHQLIMA